ncbi:hypothetical protein GUJ93_ZPchr0013g35706 [Zizania palustris]|uniref:Uncharacterized protein n=1 Tax=Zizania palustris TaxID=103762 RepID=A0A8J6C0L8_ZIZPA|nr:hypothetical protein GUJ93_ZPchr0013g35706 [Zizania palustris]
MAGVRRGPVIPRAVGSKKWKALSRWIKIAGPVAPRPALRLTAGPDDHLSAAISHCYLRSALACKRRLRPSDPAYLRALYLILDYQGGGEVESRGCAGESVTAAMARC